MAKLEELDGADQIGAKLGGLNVESWVVAGLLQTVGGCCQGLGGTGSAAPLQSFPVWFGLVG